MSNRESAATAKNTALMVTPVSRGMLQRQCACGQHTVAGHTCEACRRNTQTMLQRRTGNQAEPGIAPPIVHDVLRSPGQPLGSSARAALEPRFDHDFSHVRVHTDGKASESARAVNASAYTVGQDVVFAENQYAPATAAGARLLAHELTHTIQQSEAGSSQASTLKINHPSEPVEGEADRVAAAVVMGEGAPPHSTTRFGIQRQHEGDEKKKIPGQSAEDEKNKLPAPEDFKAAILSLDLKDPHPINLHLHSPEKRESARDKVADKSEPVLHRLTSFLPKKLVAKAKAGIVDLIMSGVPKGAVAAAQAAGVNDPAALDFIKRTAEGFMTAPLLKAR